MAAVSLLLLTPPTTTASCRFVEVNWYNPTGWQGCALYGEGWASYYDGDSVARNDCEYPWDDCEPIRITSLDTGRSIEVVPAMFCGCYVGSSEERIVDLTSRELRLLHLDLSKGLYRVRVMPLSSTLISKSLPDTATRH